MAISDAPIYREVYQFLASAPTPEQMMMFRPSKETSARLQALLAANIARTLTPDEEAELDEFEEVEHLVQMLKLHTQMVIK